MSLMSGFLCQCSSQTVQLGGKASDPGVLVFLLTLAFLLMSSQTSLHDSTVVPLSPVSVLPYENSAALLPSGGGNVPSGDVADMSVFDILNLFRKRWFLQRDDLLTRVHTAVKATDSDVVERVTLEPSFHSELVKMAVRLVTTSGYLPRDQLVRVKKVLFTFLLEIINGSSGSSFFALQQGETKDNRASREIKRLARKRQRAAARERTRMEQIDATAAKIALSCRPAVSARRQDRKKCNECGKRFSSRNKRRSHVCAAGEASPAPPTTDSTTTKGVTDPSPVVLTPTLSSPLSPAQLLATPQIAASVRKAPTVVSAVPEPTEVVRYARWARERQIARICEDCEEEATLVKLHGNFEYSCYLKCEAHSRGLGTKIPTGEYW